MAERKEIGFLQTTVSLKEQLARTTLKNFRSQGHTYVELREDGKRFVFFCTLCLAPCYSDSVLLGHLNGNLHRERLSCARITLLGENPWPFNDGVLFFHSSTGDEGNSPVSVGECVPGSLLHDGDDNRFAIVKYDENKTTKLNGGNQPAAGANGELNHCADHLLISGLLIKERTIELEARFIGFGRIAARLFETKGHLTWIDKLWCEWLGEEGPSDEEKATVPEHDFAIVTFSYFYNLGRLGLFNDPNRLLASSQSPESGTGEDSGRKRKKSFSDPEDTSDSLCNQQYDSSEEVSSARNSINSSRALLADYDDSLVKKRIIKNRTVRRELRKQQMAFSERICEVCKQKILPGKDAAAILNLKTGNLACSSRNLLGAFHLFHVSCVVHWFLFCETEILGSKMVSGKGKKRCKKHSGGNLNGLANDVTWQIFSVFCPECQGTGINIEGGVIERDTFPLSQTWRFQVKVSEGRKAWVKNPERLKNCSTGFHFPQQAEELGQVQDQEERVQSLKLVRFYRAEL